MEEVKIPISLEDGGFENGAKRILDRMEDTQREVKKTGMSVDDFAKHMQEVYRRFDKLTAAVHENTAAIGQDSRAAKQLGRDLDETTEKGVAGFGRLEKAAIGFFTVQKAKEFISTVYEVRSEIEKLETSLTTFVGNKAEADALIASIRKIPMSIKDLSGAAETMMGFGVATNEVAEDLEAIGNIARGDSQRFQSLSLAFSQASSTGKLMGQDFLQMVSAGFNPLDQIAKTTGKDMATLKKEMSEGAISAEMMRQAFIDATSEGGKFNGMLEAQSKTMAGSYNELQRVIDDMFNKIGENTEGIMKGAIDVATLLARNYETVGRVLLQLVATYGSYKAAVIANIALEKAQAFNRLASTKGLTAMQLATSILTEKTKALNAVLMKNPYVLVATAVLSLVSALAIFKNRTDEAAEAHERLNEAFGETQAKIASEEKKLDELFGKLRKSVKGTQEYKDAKKAIIDQYGQYFNGLDNEIEKVGGVENAYRKLTQAVRESVMARGREAALGEASENYGKSYSSNMGKLQNALTSKVGNKKTTEALKQIKKELKETGSISSETEKKIRKLLVGSADYGNAEAWFTSLRNNEKELQDAIKRTDQLFKLEDENIDNSAQKAKNLGEAYKEAQKSFNEADAMVKKMEKNRSAYSDEQWNEWTEKLKKRKEEFEKLGGDPDGKKAKSDAKAFNEQASRNAKSIEQQQQYEELLARMEQDAANARATANIEAIKNNGERERAERRAEYERQKRDILQQEADIYKTIYEQRKEAYENANKDKKYANTAEGKLGYGKDKNGKFVMAGTLDTDELKLYKAAYSKMMADLDALNSKHNRSETEYQRERIQAMRDYLKEFGTVQQKRLAIQQEYDDKIAEETDEAQRKILEAQKKKALDAFDIEVLKADIDWTTMFDGLGSALEEELKETLEKVETLMRSEQFKSFGAEEKAEFLKLRNSLYQRTGSGASPFDTQSLKALGEDVKSLQKATKNRKIAEANHTAAVKELENAEKELKEAEKKLKDAVSEEEKRKAKENLKEKQFKLNVANSLSVGTGKQQEDAKSEEAKARANLSLSYKKAQKSVDDLSKTFGEMTSGSLTSFITGISNVIDVLGGGNGEKGLVEAIGSILGNIPSAYAQIIAAILSIIESVGDDSTKLIEDLIDDIFNAVSKALEEALNGQATHDIMQSLSRGIGNLLSTIVEGIANIFKDGGVLWKPTEQTFKGLGEGFAEGFRDILGSSSDDYQDMLDNFEKLRDIWDEIISKKREYLNESWGTEAIKAAEEASRIAKEAIERARQLANESLDYSGGSHTIAYRMWEKGSYGDWKGQAQNIVNALEAAGLGRPQFNNMYDLTAMNAQQLAYIRENYRDLWVQLDEDYRDALENIIKYGEEIEQTTEALNQKLTTTTKNNVIDDFKNSLYDLADGEEDVTKKMAEDWQKMVNRMVIDNLVMKRYQADLEAWYQRLADIQRARNAGEFASDEEYRAAIEGLRRDYEGIMADAQQDISEMTEFGLIGAVEEAKGYFKDLRDTWKSMLTGMETDAEAFKENLQRVMFEDLVSSLLLDDDFTAWLDDWRERYKAVIEDTTLTVEQREAAINGLLKEQLDKREAIAGRAEELAEGLGIVKKTFTDMRSTWLESLTDMETDAETFVENIRMMLAKQLVEKVILGSILSDRIKGWESQLNELFAGDYTNDYITREIDRIGEEMGESFEEALGDAKQLFDALGIKKEQDSPFKDMRSLFADTLTDMEEDAEEFRKKINQTVTKGLIETFIDNYKVNGTAFKDWADEWNEAYTAAIAAGNTKEADRLLEELMRVREAMVQGADEYRKRLEDIAEDTTIKDMGDSFISSLMDETETAEDWAEEIGRTMARKIIEQMMVTSMIQPLLDNLQDAFNTAISRDGATWESVLPELTPYIEEIKTAFDDMQPMVEQILNSFGIFKEEVVDDTITSMRENWLSALMDMKAGTADFVNDIKRLLTQKLVEKLVLSSQFDTWLEGIQSQYDAILNSDMSEEQAAAAMNKLAVEWEAKAKEMQEQTQAIFDLTGWSAIVEQMNSPLGDLRSSFRSALMDMENDTEDFTNEISKLLTEAFIDRFVLGDEFDKRLAEWQEQYAAIMKGNYSEEERASLLKQLQQAIAAAKEGYAEEAQAIHDLLGTGNTSDQTATMNMADKATYDQFETYLGIAVAQQMATLQGNDVREQILATLRGLTGITSPGGDTVKEIRSLLNTSNEYLLDIKRTNRAILEQFGMKIDNIIGKLTKLV